MFKRILALSLCLSAALFQSGHSMMEVTASKEGTSVKLREDSLRWKIKGSKNNPSVINGYCFDNFKMVEWEIHSQVSLCDCYALKANFDYAYAYNKSTGNALDFSIAAGYHFYDCSCCLKITPYVGFDINRQWFKNCCTPYSFNRDVSGATEVVNTDVSTSSSSSSSSSTPVPGYLTKAATNEPAYFTGVKTLYHSFWYGPWLGVDLEYMLGDCWGVNGTFEYHFSRLYGQGHSKYGNLELDGFHSRDSFHHRGWAYGFKVGTGIEYRLCENWILGLNSNFDVRHLRRAKHHAHHLFEKGASVEGSGSGDDEVHTQRTRNRLKRVEWRSFDLAFSVSYGY